MDKDHPECNQVICVSVYNIKKNDKLKQIEYKYEQNMKQTKTGNFVS